MLGEWKVPVHRNIVIIYNDPIAGKYHSLGEEAAVAGVLDSVSEVERTLLELGLSCRVLPLRPPLAQTKSQLNELNTTDMVFNLFEGFDGYPESEAAIAGMLEEMEMRFTGSPSVALRLCENKAVTKEVLRWSGVPTPDWRIPLPDKLMDIDLGFPCIVKPLQEHGSHGISEESVVKGPQALREQVEFIRQAYHCPAIVEEFLMGREFRALLVGDGCPRVLPIEEIVYSLPSDKPRLLTYSAKWIPGNEYFAGTEERCPAEVDIGLRHELERLALRAFAALGCRGYASIDMRQNKEGRPMVIDVNPNTDISPMGGVRYPVETAGLDYATFISEILSLAICG